MAPDPSPAAGPESGAIPPPPQWWAEAPGGADPPDSLFSPHQQTWKRDSLQRELAACREELASMRSLLDDLPQMFESKFEARLQPLLEQKQRLQAGNQGLRDQLSQLQPGAGPMAGQLMPAAGPPSTPTSRRQAWRRGLRHAFGLGDRRIRL
jgi:hypothetical protein